MANWTRLYVSFWRPTDVIQSGSVRKSCLFSMSGNLVSFGSVKKSCPFWICQEILSLLDLSRNLVSFGSVRKSCLFWICQEILSLLDLPRNVLDQEILLVLDCLQHFFSRETISTCTSTNSMDIGNNFDIHFVMDSQPT